MSTHHLLNDLSQGWGKLSIEGNPLHEDETQMFAAGALPTYFIFIYLFIF
jgi:hypothetical protein